MRFSTDLIRAALILTFVCSNVCSATDLKPGNYVYRKNGIVRRVLTIETVEPPVDGKRHFTGTFEFKHPYTSKGDIKGNYRTIGWQSILIVGDGDFMVNDQPTGITTPIMTGHIKEEPVDNLIEPVIQSITTVDPGGNGGNNAGPEKYVYDPGWGTPPSTGQTEN
jgi:hypothetical protein